jgi:hypothetical protein
LAPFFQFLNPIHRRRIPWKGDQPVARSLPTHRSTQTQNKHTQTSMPRVGFEPTIPAFERANTVHALDRAVTVIGNYGICLHGSKISLVDVGLGLDKG